MGASLAIKNRVAANAPMTFPTRWYTPEGDSLSSGSASSTINVFTYTVLPEAVPKIYGSIRAISGSTLATMSVATRMASVDAGIVAGERNIMSVLIGANDLGGYAGGTDAAAAAAYSTALAVYLDARRAAGFKVIACTITPRTTAIGSGIAWAAFNARRAIVNTTIRTWVGSHCDAVADFAATSIGADNDCLDTLKYSDGLHPTDAANVVLKDCIKPVINSL